MAVCIDEKTIFILDESETLSSSRIGSKGLLLVYESENKYPGMPFLVFHSEEGTLQTSLGDLVVDAESLKISITTQQNNIYLFKILHLVRICP